ncbi:MAG TPA: 4-amino-4-deoxy-L-arabinose transferase [Nocardioides sp.]|uniref:uridine kinase family protein n=1 Tax=Nocardioides sp. TaxID=35761 RepID=UPI002E356A49|nr:4-amino-4-deoxy-L-arabinose transferase [Nocardioides sp.]HEX5087024.1 4-amino-4-deoxy-L-arabinose transferase [Nocardioides sp.]
MVALAESRPPTLGSGRLVAIDGPAGSGKTTLARAVAELTGAQVVHMDDLMDGWDGMAGTGPQLLTIVEPLAGGVAGSYRHYDWHAGRFDRTVEVPPAPWLVIEGVGAGNPLIADLVTVLVWVEADDDVRLRRGLERDGSAMEGRWRAWMRDEVGLFAAQRTAERADVRVRSQP